MPVVAMVADLERAELVVAVAAVHSTTQTRHGCPATAWLLLMAVGLLRQLLLLPVLPALLPLEQSPRLLPMLAIVSRQQ